MRKPYQWNNRARIGICRLCGKSFTTTSARRKYCHTAKCDIILEERRVSRRADLRKRRRAIIVNRAEAHETGKEVSKMGKCGGKKGCKGKGGRCGK